MAKPGVMLYFDMRAGIATLTQEEKGILLDAILDYGESGAEPELSDNVRIAWAFIRPRIDRDDEKYTKNVEQNRYAVYARECKKNKKLPLPIERWRLEGG